MRTALTATTFLTVRPYCRIHLQFMMFSFFKEMIISYIRAKNAAHAGRLESEVNYSFFFFLYFFLQVCFKIACSVSMTLSMHPFSSMP